MRSVRDIPLLANVPVLVRAALNEPIAGGAVADNFRLRRAVPTIRYLAEKGARVVLISHIGEQGTETLAPVAVALSHLLPRVTFCEDTVGAAAREAIRRLSAGDILVLENLRRDPGEEANDPEFAKKLAALADVFVQDSFDTCHRRHASIVSLPTLLPSYAGFLLEEEVAALSSALTPPSPSLAVIGGAKSSTKEALIETLLPSYSHVFVGGALANDFLKARGDEVGQSLTSNADQASLERVLANPKLVLPTDSRVVPHTALGALNAHAEARVRGKGEVEPDEVILDHGPATEALLADLVRASKGILWNGPLGKYEDGFIGATNALARAIAASRAHSVVGGGDTIASIENLGLLPRFSFISTGGGAMLEYLAKGTLPGIEALSPQPSA